MARSSVDIKDYYRQITAVDIVQVARDLMGEHFKTETADEIACSCPVHKGTSDAFKISPAKQRWYCHKCATGGDVLHLVEFLRFGVVSKGFVGKLPDSHREARDYLAKRAGLEPLAKYGLSPAEQGAYERQRLLEQAVRSALTALTEVYAEALWAPEHKEIVEWLHEHYPISDETYRLLKVGFVPAGPWTDSKWRPRQEGCQYDLAGTGALTGAELAALGGPFGVDQLSLTGAFLASSDGSSLPSQFRGRIWFPFWARGHVVFAIGRETPTSLKIDAARPGVAAAGKYKKLSLRVANGEASGAGAGLRNDWLWNEDVLLSRPERVVITEGITDAIALHERGIAVISPVTTQIAGHDWERIIARLQAARVDDVVIAMDNELSGAGMKGALAAAGRLEAAKISARLVELPLDDKQSAARERLAALGLSADEKSPRGFVDALPENVRKQAREDLAASKQDVASYFLGGATKEDFEALARHALSPVELAIDRLPTDFTEAKADLDGIIAALARLDAGTAESGLKRIAMRLGRKALSLTALKAMLADAKKANAYEARAAALRDPTDCRELVRTILALHERDAVGGHKAAAKAAFAWWREHGAKFFKTRRGEPFMYLGQEIYWLRTSDSVLAGLTQAMLLAQADIVADEPRGRVFRSVLASMAISEGEERETFTWAHTDVAGRRVWLSLANERNEIVRIDGDGVTVLPNGDNADGVILRATEQVAPIEYVDGVTGAELDGLLDKLITRRLTCAEPADREFITLWASVYGLLELAGMRPILRAEGPQRSGKTTAAKLLTTLIFGAPQHKISTIAADYADAGANPMVVLDNIEVEQYTPELKQFLLVAAGGAIRQKRAGGTDSATVQETPRCLLLTNGIEPIGGQHPELLSRSFIIAFDDRAKTRPSPRRGLRVGGEASGAAGYGPPTTGAAEGGGGGADDVFSEVDSIAELQAARARILSGLFGRWSRMLAMMRAGDGKRVARLLAVELGAHAKERLNEYLTLMYLALIVDMPADERARWLVDLHPGFRATVERLNETTDRIAQESSPIATALGGLFAAWRACERSGGHELSDKFRVDYPVEFEMGGARMRPVTARDLHLALSRYAAQQRIHWPFKSPMQLIKRIVNDAATLEEAGFRVASLGKQGIEKLRRYIVEQIGIEAPAQQPLPSAGPEFNDHHEEERWP